MTQQPEVVLKQKAGDFERQKVKVLKMVVFFGRGLLSQLNVIIKLYHILRLKYLRTTLSGGLNPSPKSRVICKTMITMVNHAHLYRFFCSFFKLP